MTASHLDALAFEHAGQLACPEEGVSQVKLVEAAHQLQVHRRN